MKEIKDRKPARVVKIHDDEVIPDDVVRYVNHSMRTAKQIIFYLKEIGWSQKDLADKLNKKESEVSKWLRGTHNFTFKTISKIESVLNRSIILFPIESQKREYKILVFSESKIIVEGHSGNSVSHESLSLFTDSGTVTSRADECMPLLN